MNEVAIRTEKLTRDFGPVRALEDLSLEIPTGIVFGFLGPNGSGKTTTIRLLLGLLEPTRGRAAVLGFDTQTKADEIRSRCGALLEHVGLYERLSAADNLELYGRIWHLSAAERHARAKDLLVHLGLWERREEKVANWSRGMKQKLAVARSLLHRPALIFLDEPTAGLDPMAAAALREELSSLAAREGVTVFLTTHILPEAEKLCAQVGVIREGKLLAVGRPDELRAKTGGHQAVITGRGFSEQVQARLLEQPDVVAVTLRDDQLSIDLKQEIEIASLVNLLVGAGVQVEEVRKGKASLEEVFLALMGDER
jgi:ABC-2 type transport system ATP-binding protein